MILLKRYMIGFKFIFQGTKDLFTLSGLLPWAVIPFIIDIFLLLLVFSWGQKKLPLLKSYMMGFIFSEPNTWLYSLLSPVVGAFLWVAFIILLLYGTFLLAIVVASPFHTIIAEKILAHYGQAESFPFCWSRWLFVSVRMFFISLVKSMIFAVIGVILFIFSFMPVLNLVSSFMALLIMAYDFMDYGLEVKEMSLPQRFRYFVNHLPEFCGMATILGVSVVVPGSTLLLLPSAVAGSSWVFCQSSSLRASSEGGES